MRKTIIVSLFSFFAMVSFSQSVGIGTNTPDSSASLDVFSNNKGFLPPRIALHGLDVSSPVASPASGLLVYNTATAGNPTNNVFPGYYYWNGSMWSKISQDNNNQIPVGTIKNFNESLAQNAVKTFTVPTGKVWKINWSGRQMKTIGNIFLPTPQEADLDKYDILLNQNDSFSIINSFFISITEYSVAAKAVRTFNDSISANDTKLYVVPANKIWKLNFLIGGGELSIGNPSIPILLPNLYGDIKFAANIFLTPNTEIRLKNSSSEILKYFFSVSEFNQ